jgi:subtilisin family serine protease
MQTLRAVTAMAIGLLAIAALLSTSTAQVSDQDYVAGQLRIKFRATAQTADRAGVLSGIQATRLRVTNRRGWDLVSLGNSSVAQAQAELQDESAVEATAPNWYVYPLLTPNDSLKNQQWYLYNYGQFNGTVGADIKAFPAWDRISGSPSVRIAFLDTGIDSLHEDLVDNLWTNPNESWNGVDDDNNGYIDDVHGWDFVYNDPQPYDYTTGSAAGHGTGMSSIAAAKSNNTVGMAGVTWSAKIVPLKMIGSIDDAMVLPRSWLKRRLATLPISVLAIAAFKVAPRAPIAFSHDS